MASEHNHTDQLYVEKHLNIQSGQSVVISYCLSCGEIVYKVVIKD